MPTACILALEFFEFNSLFAMNKTIMAVPELFMNFHKLHRGSVTEVMFECVT